MTQARDKANIPVLNFASKGIDDNATSTVLTITSGTDVQIGSTNSGVGGSIDLSIGNTSSSGGITLWSPTSASHSIGFADGYTGTDRYRGYLEYLHSGDSMRFGTGATERMRLTSTGLGIGTSSPSTSLHISSASPQISLTETDQSNKQYRIGSFGGAYAVYDVSATQYRHIIDTNGNHIFNEGSQDCDFRVESNGNANMLFVDGGNDAVIFGDGSNTSPATSGTATHSCFKNGGSKLELSASSNPCIATNRVNSEGATVEFRQAGGLRGSISVGGASTSYNTSSDYRLKENVSYDFDATTRLKQLKPARFNWINDETNTLVDGFIAHEVSDIIPEAIIGTKDAVDEDGNIQLQQIDQSKLVPLLVKTIQELEARITTLEANNP